MKRCQYSSTPVESTQEVRKIPYFGWKLEVKSFPTVYDTPMLLSISVSYTVGKLLKPTFQWSEVRNCVFEYLLPASLVLMQFPHSTFTQVCVFHVEIFTMFTSTQQHETKKVQDVFLHSDVSEVENFIASCLGMYKVLWLTMHCEMPSEDYWPRLYRTSL